MCLQGGVVYVSTAFVSISRCVVSDNTVDNDEGLASKVPACSFSHARRELRSPLQGGVVYNAQGEFVIADSSLFSNFAKSIGGTISLEAGIGTVTNSSFYNNTAPLVCRVRLSQGPCNHSLTSKPCNHSLTSTGWGDAPVQWPSECR